MRLRVPVLLIVGALCASAGAVARADTPAAHVKAEPADGDVTMTVIPSGADVVKSVVQNIVVPANANKVAKSKIAEPQKAPAAGQDSEAAEQAAQQLAEEAAVHQAGQTQQQVQQVAQQAQQQAQPAAAATQKPPPPPWG